MIQLNSGILVAVEGIDGSGKSTLADNLVARLVREQWPCIKTYQPGSTRLGSHLRSILHDKDIQKTARAEYLLFASDRAQNMNDIVMPALQTKQLVISDRMGDSSVVYQGYGRGLDIEMIKTINTWAMEGLEPDITIYVRVPYEIARHRLSNRNVPLTSIEQEPESFFEALVNGFDTIMKEKANVIILDGTQAQKVVTQQAYEALTAWIQKNKLQI